ncbi:MAG: 50S ribosomal protein L6 [Deltaproteobacteria bacterium]|nr:50S ribosomal protein L6 [Deltaproteobacteria bacterium]
MSRIGKQHIDVPDKVKVSLKDKIFSAQGPLGKEDVQVHDLVDVDLGDNKKILLKRKKEDKKSKSTHGLMRMLVYNAVHGVSKGFEKNLEISGVGYRAEVKGKVLNLTLGFSHVVNFPIAEGIKIAVADQNKIKVMGSNKELVGRVASQIRAFRPPEPYKGKGIKYEGEHIIKKVGKTATGGK